MAITNYIVKKFINYESEKSLAFKFRKKRAERIKLLINECYDENKEVNIIDIGGTKTYWKIIPKNFLIEKKVHITVVNLPSTDPLPENDEIFTFYNGNGCNLFEFKDNSFHIAHSNSVIEHVGDWGNIVNFSMEIKRVANIYYLQTPNYWFPIEPHFIAPFYHWLPKAIRVKLILHFDLGWFKKATNYLEARKIVESCNLLSKEELVNLFPESHLFREKVILFIKSFIVTNR
jgi:hypothetical protein